MKVTALNVVQGEEQHSDFGAGWLLYGVATLHQNSESAAFITFGSGQTAMFKLTASRDAENGITRFAYDKNDKLTRGTAPNGAVTTFENDLLGCVTTETGPDRGQRACRSGLARE